jgi:tRNA(Ile)-lysidine synthase
LAGGVELIRPLLGLGRSDVLSYLKAVNQPDRQDSSNRDPRFVRNRIRHELLPLLTERFNPAIVRILGRLARQAETVYQGQKRQARALLVSAERPRAGRTFVFDRAALAAAPRELVGEAFRLIWEQEGWPAARLGFDAWDRLAGVACGEIGGVDLPGGIRVRGRGRVVLIEPPE